MSETLNGDWERWQAVWQSAPATAAPPPTPVAEMRRRLIRHRRAAWAYTALDVGLSLGFVVFGVVWSLRNPTLPIIVWAANILVFSAISVGFGAWNRRDALFFSAQPTADFLALLRVRLARRERVPRFVARFVAVEIVFGVIYYAIWFPGALPIALALYAAMLVPLSLWWWWYRRRLRRERAQIDALSGDAP